MTDRFTESPRRLRREARTLEAMIRIHCEISHGTSRGEACGDCRALMEHSLQRLARCHFGAAKPECRDCPTPCYAAVAREQIRTVMRVAGPRMMFRHPLLAILHIYDRFLHRGQVA